MNKLYFTATFIILTANNINAQQYDTYGRSQATREWQETQRHYNSMNPGKKSSSTPISGEYNAYGWGDNSGMRQQEEAARRQETRWKEWYAKIDKLEALIKSRGLRREPAYFYQLQAAARDAGFNDYNISRFFGYDAKEYEEMLLQQIRGKSGVAEADRVKADFDKDMERLRREKQLEQEKKDKAFRAEIGQFFVNNVMAKDTAFGIEVRKNGFKEMQNYLNPLLARQKKLNRYEYTDYKIRKSITDGEISATNIQYCKNYFHIQTKMFDSAYRNGNLPTTSFSNDAISNMMADFVYSGLISEKNTTNVILEKAAYAHTLNSNKINHLAYALFLDNDIDGALDVLQNHLDKYPSDTLNKIGYLNKLILLKFYKGKNDEAIGMFNKNSSMAIKEKNDLLEFITLDITSTLKKYIAEDERANYYIYPLGILMDIDLLTLVQPENENAKNLRAKLGKILNCKRFQSSINALWPGAEKKNSNTKAYLQQLIDNGSRSGELRGTAKIIGFPVYVPDKSVYEEALNDLLKFNKKNSNPELFEIEIVKGYLKLIYTIVYADGEKKKIDFFYKIEDLEKPILLDCESCYEYIKSKKYYQVSIPLKASKYGLAPDHKDHETETDERTINFNYTSKSKAEKALNFYTTLFEALQKP
jgi:TolA-binding protein